MSEKQYPLAEEFTSLQGEGCYTGTPMRFVRLAGCNVGKYLEAPPGDPLFKVIDGKAAAVCETLLGERFVCDTNYRAAYSDTVENIFSRIEPGIEHLCLTGGEPFLHDLTPFREECFGRHITLHIETSGTKPFDPIFADAGSLGSSIWIACSPKVGFLPRNARFVSEWKFVAGPEFDPVKARAVVNGYLSANKRPMFIQPVNGVEEIDIEALRHVQRLVEKNPDFRLSLQLHKLLGVR